RRHGRGVLDGPARVLGLPGAAGQHEQGAALPAHLLQEMPRRDRPLPQGTALSRMQDPGGGSSGGPAPQHPAGSSARGHQEQPAAGRQVSPRECVHAGEHPDWPRSQALPPGPSPFLQPALFGRTRRPGRGGHPGSAHARQATGSSDALRQGALRVRRQGPRGPELPQGGPDSAAQASGPALAPRGAPGQAGLRAGQLRAGGGAAALPPAAVQGTVRLPHGGLRREGLPRLPQGRRHHRNPKGGRKLGRRKAGRTHRHLPHLLRRSEDASLFVENCPFFLGAISREWSLLGRLCRTGGFPTPLSHPQRSSGSFENCTPHAKLGGPQPAGDLGQRRTFGNMFLPSVVPQLASRSRARRPPRRPRRAPARRRHRRHPHRQASWPGGRSATRSRHWAPPRVAGAALLPRPTATPWRCSAPARSPNPTGPTGIPRGRPHRQVGYPHPPPR
ncbi:unnamed protein product, partial [Ixodes pacificus]